MSQNADDADRTGDGRTGDYAALSVEDAAVVIYDRDDHRAWVQSDRAVLLDEMV